MQAINTSHANFRKTNEYPSVLWNCPEITSFFCSAIFRLGRARHEAYRVAHSTAMQRVAGMIQAEKRQQKNGKLFWDSSLIANTGNSYWDPVDAQYYCTTYGIGE